MKRLISTLLSVCIVFSLSFNQAFAENDSKSVTPTCPEWITPDEYLTFPGSAAYEADNWAIILKLREMAQNGDKGISGEFRIPDAKLFEKVKDDPGIAFERTLLFYKIYQNGGRYNDVEFYYVSQKKIPTNSLYWMDYIKKGFEVDSNEQMLMNQWLMRLACCYPNPPKEASLKSYLHSLLLYPGFDRSHFLAGKDFDRVRDTPWFPSLFDICVSVDDEIIKDLTAPKIVNGRTLVPIRPVCEAIGADVSWDEATRAVTITRAEKEIKLTIGSAEALVGGKSFALDTAPVIISGRTMLPLRFVMETLSQKVTWDERNRVVSVEEDMSFEGDSNMKAWLLGAAAILAKTNNRDPYLVGTMSRSKANVDTMRKSLEQSWSVENREELIYQINAIGNSGHSYSFDEDIKLFKSLSESERAELLSSAEGVDKYMWPMVQSLDKKWGSKSIRAWDWFRALHLCGWGYLTGYLELKEAYSLGEPFAKKLRETFSSWDEASENYLDGYAWWGRIDLSKPGNAFEKRSQIYEKLKENQEKNGVLFDPEVWKEPVRLGK